MLFSLDRFVSLVHPGRAESPPQAKGLPHIASVQQRLMMAEESSMV
jgi:hypothetical protein